MKRSKTGEAIGSARRGAEELAKLDALLAEADGASDLPMWKRARAIRGYVDGERVVDIAAALRVQRGSVNQWLRWYETLGVDGLRTGRAPGAAPRLTAEQRAELSAVIVAGPIAAGYASGVWTGPIVGQLIRDRYGVTYHNHHIPRLLHQLGFSVQRPRKRLAKADAGAQAYWLSHRFPEIKKKAAACRGVVLFEDEASFWLDGTLHQTWSRVGVQPRVDTLGLRKTGHVYGAVDLEEADFSHRFADVFNGHTFHEFLLQLVDKHGPRKVFLIIDNGPVHWLDEAGKEWLQQNPDRIELHRLPPYSPDLNPMEGVWKTTRKLATHNRYYLTTAERDQALRTAFASFAARPELIAGQVLRFRRDDRSPP